MKTKLFLILFAILPLVACSQTRLLSTLPTGDEVSKVYISPAMMKLSQNYVEYSSDGEEFKDMVKDIKSIEVYNCENAKLFDQVVKAFDDIVKTTKGEEMVYNEDAGEISRIYIVYEPGQDEPTAMLIFNSDKDAGEVNVVALHGKIDLAAAAE